MLYVIALVYFILVAPPLVYLLLISLAGIKRPHNRHAHQAVTGTIGVLIPAHNEKLTIKRTLDSLLNARNHDDHIEIHVIADNCSDHTADIARQYPVNVLEREDKDHRGKGAALQWAISQLVDKDYDYIMIIDADSIVNDGFFSELRLALDEPCYGVVQARYEGMRNEYSGIKRLAMLGFNVLRARGRIALGGSAGILGNGFIISKAALAAVPFQANSVVEDLEYHMRLIQADIIVNFCDRACIYGEMPRNAAADEIQSTRWEGGRLSVLKSAFLPLFRKSCHDILQKKWHTLNALLDMMLLPIGYMVWVLLIGLLFPYTQPLAVFGLFVIGCYVLCAAKCGEGLRELKVLKNLPAFLLKKIYRIPALIASSSTATIWRRTPRE